MDGLIHLFAAVGALAFIAGCVLTARRAKAQIRLAVEQASKRLGDNWSETYAVERRQSKARAECDELDALIAQRRTLLTELKDQVEPLRAEIAELQTALKVTARAQTGQARVEPR